MFVDAQILISFNSDQQSFDEGYNHLTCLYTSTPPQKKTKKKNPRKFEGNDLSEIQSTGVNFCTTVKLFRIVFHEHR